MSLLEVRDLNVWYAIDGGHSHAVRGIDITLNPGDRVGLVGESGCGKTTALMAMMGLLPPGSYVDGQLLLDGENLLAGGEATLRPHRWTDLALVFQGAMNAFNPVRRIEDQIVEPMLLHRVGAASEARGRARELLELVGIPAAAGRRFPHELSGGMRQRAMLAMALSCRPRVLRWTRWCRPRSWSCCGRSPTSSGWRCCWSPTTCRWSRRSATGPR
jgi:ABC-type glutathione transport system ATPase component